MTLEQLDSSMSYVEFNSWMRFYAEEPFGDVRADLRAGIIASTVAKVMGGNRRARPYDFMPIVRKQQEADDAIMPVATRMRHTFESNLGPLHLRRVKLPKARKRR
jgi:hypothetical protein